MFLAGKRKVFPCPLPSRCAFICLNAFFCRDPSWECCFFRFHLEAGSIVYVSGMQGMDMKKMKHLSIFVICLFLALRGLPVLLRLVEGGAKEETKQILQNLDTVLQARSYPFG